MSTSNKKPYVPSRSAILSKLITRNANAELVATPEGQLWLAVLLSAFKDKPEKHEAEFMQSLGFTYICDLLLIDSMFVIESVAKYDRYMGTRLD